MSDKEAAEIIAKLVMAKPRSAIAYLREEVIAEAVAKEREACARIVDGWRAFKASSDMADAIRARGSK